MLVLATLRCPVTNPAPTRLVRDAGRSTNHISTVSRPSAKFRVYDSAGGTGIPSVRRLRLGSPSDFGNSDRLPRSLSVPTVREHLPRPPGPDRTIGPAQDRTAKPQAAEPLNIIDHLFRDVPVFDMSRSDAVAFRRYPWLLEIPYCWLFIRRRQPFHKVRSRHYRRDRRRIIANPPKASSDSVAGSGTVRRV